MNRHVSAYLVMGLWVSGIAGSPAGAAQTPVPGPPGSGLLTGQSNLRINDVSAALQLLVGGTVATPGQVAAVDLNDNGTIDLGDLVLLLRAAVGAAPLPQRPPSTSKSAPMAFPVQTGWYDDHTVLFIATDDSDPSVSAAMKVNFAPSLSAVKGSDGVKPMYFFYTEQNGQRTPVPGQFPVFGSSVLESEYTPLWQVMHVIVDPSYKANTLTKDDDITADKGPSAGGSVVRIDSTDEVLNGPILFDPDAGDTAQAPYATPQATFSADGTSVTLPTEEVLYDGKTFLMVSPDTADAADSQAHHSNAAPLLAKADAAAIPFYLVLGPNGPAQMPVLSAAPDPIGPGNTATDYSPVWRLTQVQWTGAMAANPPVLQSDDDVKAHLASGDLKSVPGGFDVTCPVVALEGAPAPAPTPVTVDMTHFTFSPKDITVPVGTTVTWVNQDQAAHTATSGSGGASDGTWDSGTVRNGQSFSFTFTKAGTFPYYCTFHFHMGMVGSVTVK